MQHGFDPFIGRERCNVGGLLFRAGGLNRAGLEIGRVREHKIEHIFALSCPCLRFPGFGAHPKSDPIGHRAAFGERGNLWINFQTCEAHIRVSPGRWQQRAAAAATDLQHMTALRRG